MGPAPESTDIVKSKTQRRAGRESIEQIAVLHPLGGNGRGGIDAYPTLPIEPQLYPGMGVGLAHDEVTAQAIVLAAQVAEHDARRNTGDAHHQGEAACVVLAESPPGLEQELVCRVGDALAELPYEQREVILLHLHSGLTFREIAASQKMSINTVQSRYRYGLQKLKSELNSEV